MQSVALRKRYAHKSNNTEIKMEDGRWRRFLRTKSKPFALLIGRVAKRIRQTSVLVLELGSRHSSPLGFDGLNIRRWFPSCSSSGCSFLFFIFALNLMMLLIVLGGIGNVLDRQARIGWSPSKHSNGNPSGAQMWCTSQLCHGIVDVIIARTIKVLFLINARLVFAFPTPITSLDYCVTPLE